MDIFKQRVRDSWGVAAMVFSGLKKKFGVGMGVIRVPLAMLGVQVIATGLQILSRVILSEGAFIFAVMMYRHILAAFCVLPFALYLERGAVKKVGWAGIFWLFMVALSGISMGMGLFYYGLKDTTATFATNFLNLVPVVTFLFSTLLRIEKLGTKTRAGKIKTLGAALCLLGAITIGLYKGKSFYLTHHHGHQRITIPKTKQRTARGTVFLVSSCISYAVWYILQVKMFKAFPHKYWATLLTCVMAAAQVGVIGVCVDRNLQGWKLSWNLQLVTIVYSGILATAATFCLVTWAIAEKGPTYTAMFNPLSLIMVAIAEAVFLGQEISAGSLIGMSLIIVGLYAFLWGKNRGLKPTLLPSGGGECAAAVAAESGESSTVVPAASPKDGSK